MFRSIAPACILSFGWLVASASIDSAVAQPGNDPGILFFEELGNETFSLVGRDSRMQLLVSQAGDHFKRDVTLHVEYTSEPAGIVQVSDSGLVTPLTDGTVVLRATDAQGRFTEVNLNVQGTQEEQLVSFPSQVTPILTKLGCNGGGCHGKAAGQNGFKLSLLGFDPNADYERLVRESRGRRLARSAPERSLLLLKAINDSPHGGGQRLKYDSHEYRVLLRWISQGTPYSVGTEKQLSEIRMFPQQGRVPIGGQQQLVVRALYSDGSSEDITRAAVFESNDPEMAEVDETGLVTIGQLSGDVAVMASYQGHVSVFQADVPVANSETLPIAEWPQPHNLIDTHVDAKLRALGLSPSGLCDDATYIRRVTLDICGRLPTIEEIQEFNLEGSTSKRAELVERLLASDDYAHQFARKWSLILRNRRPGGSLVYRNMIFHQWLIQGFLENKPYDQFVRELVTASGSVSSNPAVAWLNQVTDKNERIEDTAQLFLGQRIACARCHHHPYEKWSQRDYFQFSAYLSLVTKKAGSTDPSEAIFISRPGSPSARHPRTGENLKPAPLSAFEQPTPDTNADPRVELADWMTDPSNPFFARSLVNRYWKHFMGRGLVEPEDDMRVTNPPSNPELLDAMAQSFKDSSYDLKELIRLICASRAYNTSHEPLAQNLADRRSYSRFYPKRLTAEVLLDALDQVARTSTDFAGMPATTRAVELPDTGFDSYFLTVFGQPEGTTACECERSQEASLAQSLHLLNSAEMQSKLSDQQGRSASLAKDPRPLPEKLDELYQIAFSRLPNESERVAAMQYIQGAANTREAFEDLVWSLLNSKEFLFNH